jgi:two-component system response regulator AtoC
MKGKTPEMKDQPITGKIRVLAVDDDPNVTWILSDGLNAEEFVVETCNDASTAIQRLGEFHPDVALLDIKMPGMDGIEALKHIKRLDPSVSVIVISGHADTPVVVQAIQGGAEDFMVKPFEVEMVEICINKVLEKKDLQSRVHRLELELAKETMRQEFIGESAPILRLRELVEQIGPTDLNVLVRGETGTGKDVLARMIHQVSDRARGPFVKVNCAALPAELLESELFGHERGAFTGAYKSKPGRFELADKGTIFLDEIGEMPAPLQATLLQVLEHREFFRVGGTDNIKVDVRLITATNIDIERRIREGGFRLDLFYRLNDISIFQPPLRDRGDDIALLGQHFLHRYCERFGKKAWGLSADLLRAMGEYAWPGNVRELESLMKRIVLFGEAEAFKQLSGASPSGPAALGPTPIFTKVDDADPGVPLSDDYFSGKTLREVNEGVVSNIERRAIELALEKNGWNRKRTSGDLGISYRCLLYKIQEYELKPEGDRRSRKESDEAPVETRLREAS